MNKKKLPLNTDGRPDQTNAYLDMTSRHLVVQGQGTPLRHSDFRETILICSITSFFFDAKHPGWLWTAWTSHVVRRWPEVQEQRSSSTEHDVKPGRGGSHVLPEIPELLCFSDQHIYRNTQKGRVVSSDCLAELTSFGGIIIGWSKGGLQRRAVLSSRLKFFHFHAVFRKNSCRIIGFDPNLGIDATAPACEIPLIMSKYISCY